MYFTRKSMSEASEAIFKEQRQLRKEKLLANQQVIKTPIVRNGKQATVGYEPTVWKSWS